METKVNSKMVICTSCGQADGFYVVQDTTPKKKKQKKKR
jgi:hypothetical protein